MPRRVRPWAVAAVLALHLPLLMRPEPPAVRDAPLPGRPPLVLHLLAAPTRVEAPAAPLRSKWGPAPPRPAPANPSEQAPRPVPQPITLPPPAMGTPVSASSAPAGPPPLDLALPPTERRGDTPSRPAPAARPRSVESGIARALADGPLVQEDLGNGRIRLRQGRRCVELRDSHMARIDPFNQSVNPIPKQGEDCSR